MIRIRTQNLGFGEDPGGEIALLSSQYPLFCGAEHFFKQMFQTFWLLTYNWKESYQFVHEMD